MRYKANEDISSYQSIYGEILVYLGTRRALRRRRVSRSFYSSWTSCLLRGLRVQTKKAQSEKFQLRFQHF